MNFFSVLTDLVGSIFLSIIHFKLHFLNILKPYFFSLSPKILNDPPPSPIPQGSLRSISGINTWRTGHLKVVHIDTISWISIRLVFTYAMLKIKSMIFKV